jgi:hypothetical protein
MPCDGKQFGICRVRKHHCKPALVARILAVPVLAGNQDLFSGLQAGCSYPRLRAPRIVHECHPLWSSFLARCRRPCLPSTVDPFVADMQRREKQEKTRRILRRAKRCIAAAKPTQAICVLSPRAAGLRLAAETRCAFTYVVCLQSASTVFLGTTQWVGLVWPVCVSWCTTSCSSDTFRRRLPKRCNMASFGLSSTWDPR